MHDAKAFQKNVWFLLGATRGGKKRGEIMHALLERPLNTNQLAEKLKVDYKTVQHHLEKLEKNNWVVRKTSSYADLFFPAFTEEQKSIFETVWNQINPDLGKNI